MSDEDPIGRLQAGVRRQPFEAFEIEFPGGRVTIDDPQAVALRNGVAVYVGPQGTCTWFDAAGARPIVVGAEVRRPISTARMALSGLLILHVLGICGSVLAATVEIESIVGTGPVFSVLGLVLAELGRRSGARAIFWLGCSTLVLSLSIFGLINLAEWGPDAARMPVSIILLIYEAAIVPIALTLLWRLYVPAPDDARAWQFDLKSMIWFTCLLAVGLAAGRSSSDLGLSLLPAIATGLLVATLAALAWIGCRAKCSDRQ